MSMWADPKIKPNTDIVAFMFSRPVVGSSSRVILSES